MTWWLALAFPLAALALVASVAGIVTPAVYASETPNWAGQAVGQDIANVVAYAALVPLTLAAARGSLAALLGWAGIVAYGIYAYSIYAFSIHFGPLFLAYAAALGLSVYMLIGALGGLDAERVRASFRPDVPRWSTAGVLIGVGVLFALLWLSEIVPATVSGKVPASLETAGLVSNPVYVLDLALLLPATVIGGVLLLQGRAWGYVLAPILLTVLFLLSLGIVAGFGVLAVRGETAPVAVAVVIAAIAVAQLVILARFLRGLRGAPA
ncbi:MAG TPA: hypothetical protein VJP45_07285 [Candidatus Limnocylindria bacterium]|nr:hypothetical protein [Candidatus Limnocylindria bacterium]